MLKTLIEDELKKNGEVTSHLINSLLEKNVEYMRFGNSYTLARVNLYNKIELMAYAKNTKIDKFNFEIGKEIALRKLKEKMFETITAIANTM